MNGKRELTLPDLAYIFALDLKTSKRRIEEGEDAIQRAILIYQILERTRESNTIKHSCPRCGILRAVKGECLMRKNCDERIECVAPLLLRAPFNLPELKISRADVFILMHNRRKINKFLKKLDRPDQPSLRFGLLLGLNPAESQKLKSMRTLV
jgi:hypothetical protein